MQRRKEREKQNDANNELVSKRDFETREARSSFILFPGTVINIPICNLYNSVSSSSICVSFFFSSFLLFFTSISWSERERERWKRRWTGRREKRKERGKKKGSARRRSLINGAQSLLCLSFSRRSSSKVICGYSFARFCASQSSKHVNRCRRKVKGGW